MPGCGLIFWLELRNYIEPRRETMRIQNKLKTLFTFGPLSLVLMMVMTPQAGRAEVITGTINQWLESGPILSIGNGTNDVHIWWSLHSLHIGYFYGSLYTGDSDVANAP